MSLTIKAKNNCKTVTVITKPYSAATSGTLTIKSITYGGSPLTTPVTFSGGSVTKIILNTEDLPAATGAFMFELEENGIIVSSKALLIHCDIDCCIVKLTNELLACECDCPKCSSALAKAQKVFLLLQSANAKVDEVNSEPRGSTVTGHYEDISDKYKKAREICDGSCGCEC